MRYEISDSTTGVLFFEALITAQYTTTMDDAFSAVRRLRLANEGAVRKNIELSLQKLSELDTQSRTRIPMVLFGQYFQKGGAQDIDDT